MVILDIENPNKNCANCKLQKKSGKYCMATRLNTPMDLPKYCPIIEEVPKNYSIINWHYVKDELPKEDKWYIISYHSQFKNMTGQAYYSTKSKTFGDLNDFVYAWAELPEGAKEND